MSTQDVKYEAVLRQLSALAERVKAETRLLRPEDAADRLAMSVTQLSRYKALGLVATVNVGDRWRVSTMEIARISEEGLPSLSSPAQEKSKTGASGAAAVRAALRVKKQPA